MGMIDIRSLKTCMNGVLSRAGFEFKLSELGS